MRKGFIYFVVLLVVALIVLAVGPVIYGLFIGGGFDPSP